MGGVKVSGQGGGLNFTANLDISQALKNAETLKKNLSDLAVSSTGVVNARSAQTTADKAATKSITEYQQKQIALRQTLVDAQATSEQLRQKNLQLDASFKAGKITAQELAAAERQNRKDRLSLAEATKAARQAQVAATGSYDEASNRLKELGRSIRSAEGGFTSTNPAIRAQIIEYNKLNDSLKAFDAQMGNHQRNVGGYREALRGAGNDLKSLALNYLSAYAALAELNHIINTNAEISDSFADVRRTAGLTDAEVNQLADSLKKIDTRTSLKALLDIAVIGGQLGIAKDQLAGFTKAIDQLSVTLSGEISGGAEAVASALGKINGVFKVQEKEGTDVERSFNKTGSAILALGQAGLATGEFLQDFGLRTAGVANTAKISLPTILAYGAVLEETGSSAEVAGTALARLIGNLASKREQFFTIARIGDSTLTLKSFTDLINRDANAALQKFFAGLNAGGKDLTSFTDLIDKIGLRGGPAKNAIIALAQNQGLLNERIGESVTAYNAGALSAEQFALKNDNLAASIAKLKNQFENDTTSGSIGKFFKAIVDGVRESLFGIEKLAGSIRRLFTNRSGAGFLNNLTGSEKSLGKIDYISDNYKSSAKELQDFLKNNNSIGASSDIVTSVLADKPVKELKEMFSQYKKATNQAATALISYNKGIGAGELENGGAVSLAETQKNYDKLKKVLSIIKDAYVEAKAKSKDAAAGQVDDSKQIADSELKTTDAIHKRIKELQNDALDNPANKEADVKRIQSLKQTLKSISGNLESAAAIKYALKSRNELQSQIDALTKKGTDKQLSADEQEVESVKDKYVKLKAAAIAFNNDPANKNKGLKVDAGGLVRAQDNELVAVRDKQDTEKLKVTLEAEKKLYDDYEAYKLKVGKDNADKQYADLLDTDSTYLQELEARRSELVNGDGKAKGGSDVDSAATQLQLKLVEKEIADEKLLQQKKNDEIYADAYQSALTNAQDILLIQEDYQRKVSALGDKANSEQLDNLKRQRDARIRSENEANADQKSGYADLLLNLDAMTRGKAMDALESAKDVYTKQYKDNLITAQFYADRINEINSKEDELAGNNIFNGISRAIQRYKQAKDAFDKSTDKGKDGEASIAVDKARAGVYNTIASGAETAAQAVSGLSDIFDQLGVGSQGLQDALKGVSGVLSGAGELAKGLSEKDPVSIVTGSVKLLTSAISLFSHKDKDLQKKIDGYQRDLAALGQAYKQLDRDVANAVGNDIYSDQAAQIENLKKQQANLIKQRDAEASKKKADQSKIDDYNAQIAEIPNQIDDINKSISQNLIQGTFRELSDSLADALTTAFQAGEDGIAAMDKSLDQFIANAIKNTLKLAFFDKDVKQFTDDLTAYAKAHDNSVIGFNFDAYKAIFNKDADNFNAALKESSKYFQSTGDSTVPNSAQGQIQASITEDTATRLYGVFAGTQVGVLQVRDILKASMAGASLGDLYQSAQARFSQLVLIEANTRRGADNTDGIAATLKNIEKNTNSSSLRGAGLG